MVKDSPKISVVIPLYNSKDTVKESLKAVFSSSYKDFEVIVVDDGSTDGSADIAKKFPVNLVRLEVNKGQSAAKNIGAEAARGDIIVFVDSDIIVKEETLSIIEETFRNDPALSAVTGLLSKESPCDNFFSQYKNLYMNHNFRNLPEDVDFLFTSVAAIRSSKFREFLDEHLGVEDTELGQHLKSSGEKVLLNKKLEVTHLKRYSLASFVKNDFKVPFGWVSVFLMYGGYVDVVKKHRFAHASGIQLMSLLLAPASLLLYVMSLFNSALLLPASILLAVFLALHYSFLVFLYGERGGGFLVKSVFVNYFDYIIMLTGVVSGLIFAVVSRISGK